MLLSIITLNYKKPHLTLACLASLGEQFQKEIDDGMIEIIVVDNASGDTSIKQLQEAKKKKQYQHLTIIENANNEGFGKGNNSGATQAKGEFLLFLNNDTVVKDRGILAMAQYLETHPEIAILGGQLRNPDGTRQPSTGKFYTPFNAFLLLMGMQKFGLLDRSPLTISEVDWVKGGLFMIRKKVFTDLSGFDENIFMYMEDMELCYRANQKNLKVAFYPDVQVIHKEHGSANRTFAIIQIYKGLLYFYQKHRSRLEYTIIKALLWTKAYLLITLGKLTGNTYLVTTYREAIQ